MSLGTYLKVYVAGGHILADPYEEPRIDAAVTRYIDSGRNMDTLLSLDLMDGSTYKCLASVIAEWFVSTPDSRRASMEWEQAAKDEEEALRQELGIWDDA